ncbi:minor tail protein [Streptomyces phage Daudau]|uniref:Minor tail protein n=1 Tax=Streptomyces phage Daudau TaxID=2041206 RepID=A0A291LI31_9CAUD|nr:minor tail protein [Streptomyces phage Daudau]ATI18723.1 minor tail protein [Streptomyces phage Daudau]
MPTTYYPYDNGTVGPTGPEGPQGPTGPAGADGVVQSVNGQSVAAVVLDAADVNALPSNANALLGAQYLWLDQPAGTYRAFGYKTGGVDRWLMQVDDVAETGSAAGSNFRLSARNDDGSFNKTAVYVTRSGGQTAFLTTTVHGSASVTSGGSVGLRDITTDPTTTSGGTFIYSKGGKLFVKQSDGTSFQISQISYPVLSVNGDTGNVTLGAADVGALPTSGGTLTGQTKISGNAGSYRTFALATAGTNRWQVEADNTTEPGDGSGSDLVITARKDDGSFQKHVMYAKRSTGQTSFGATNPLGAAQTTVVGAFGVRDVTADPADATGGIQLYSKAGKPYIKQGDGTIFQVGSGGGTGGGAVDSVNGMTGVVTLDADDVGAIYKTSETYQQNTRAIFQGDGTNNIMEWRNPSGSLVSRIGANGNIVGQGVAYLAGGVQLGSTSTDFGGGAGAILGVDNATTAPTTNPASGVIVYAEGGKLKVRQDDGTVVIVGNAPVSSVNGLTGAVNLTIEDLEGIPLGQKGTASGVATLDASTKIPVAQLPDIAVPSSFTPESLGLKAWAGDPDFCASGFDYTGVGTGRMTAVYIDRSMSVSKIVWHVFGYAGGLKTGSWAGIYNTSGTLMRATGDMSTASYEPAEQHDTGGGWSSSNLTSSVTLSPGVYYILWRFNYTASPVDGPALARFESGGACQSVMGTGNNIWRHGSYTTSATSAPSSITIGSLQRDSIRFWVGLA